MWNRILAITAFGILLAACMVTFGFMFGQREIRSLVMTGHFSHAAQGVADKAKSGASADGR
jgi:hypothetical protein